MGTEWSRRQSANPGRRYTGSLSVASTGTTVPAYGVTVINSTAASKRYNLAAPVAGQVKIITCTKATTTNTALVFCATGTCFQKSSNSTATTTRKATFNSGNQTLHLMGVSATKWAILANVNTVTLGTT